MTKHTKKTIQNYINTKVHASESPVYQHLYEMMCNTPKNGAVAAQKGRAERRDSFDFLKKKELFRVLTAPESICKTV
jgi:hypothetical protein